MNKSYWQTPEVVELNVKNTESGPNVFSQEDPWQNFYGPLGS
jgi:hypothetical protein